MARYPAKEVGTGTTGTNQQLLATTERLERAGCIAAGDEAGELIAASGGDTERLEELVVRRCTGEPLAWLIGSVQFCGEVVVVQPGVYVPRWQSEPLALEAVARLPERGVAVDLCTGAGPIAVVMARRRPSARIVASEIDHLAAGCARGNGIETYVGDLGACLPADLREKVDVVTAVVPYVPTDALRMLPRDVTAYEPAVALDGGTDGTELLLRAAIEAATLLHPGGSLLLELGGNQSDLLTPVLIASGYRDLEVVRDEDHELRALYCRLGPNSPP